MKRLRLATCMLLSAAAASAHMSDSGVDYRAYKDRYGQSCCDDRDCRAAADFAETIVKDEAVVRLLIDGDWITVSRAYVVAKVSPDGRAHFCGRLHRSGRTPAEIKPEPICVILPPRDV